MNNRHNLTQLQGRPADGFAMPAVIFALVIMGVLVVGGFFMARQETQIGFATENSASAFYLAEQGVAEVLENWDGDTFGGLSRFDTASVTGSTSNGDWSVDVVRLTRAMFLLESAATITTGGALRSGATRSVSQLVKVPLIDIDAQAALATRGNLTFGGSARLKGLDTNPDGSGKGRAVWGADVCEPVDPLNADRQALLIDDESNINWNGNETRIKNAMNGLEPPVKSDGSLTYESLLDFGDAGTGDSGWEVVTSRATNTIYGTMIGTPEPSFYLDGSCNEEDVLNWGDPLDPTSTCGNHFPIIHLANTGQSKIAANGAGQGILLVEGDLEVTGGFEFYGPVFVRGTLTTTGSGGHFWGAVIAGNVDLQSESTVLGDAEIQFSSCALQRAIDNSGINDPGIISERSWIDRTSATAR